MKEELAPEIPYESIEDVEHTQRFARVRHAIGTIATGVYMLTGGETARRVWGGAAAASAAFFVLTPNQDFEAAGLQIELKPALPTHHFNGAYLDGSGGGAARYPTHLGPTVEIELSNVQDADRIKEGIQELRESPDLSIVEKDAKDALIRLGLTGTLVSLAGVAGATLFDIYANKGKKNRKALITAVSGVAATGFFLGGLPYASQNPDAIQEATYIGLVNEISELFGGTEGITQKYQNNIDELGPIQEYLSVLIDKSIDSQDIPEDAIGIILAGDTHCMPRVYDLIGNVGKNDKRIQMVLLSGDHTDFGSVQENQFCFDGIEEIEKPIIAVSGNHDSGSTMQHLQDNFGVVTLDDSSATVAGVNIFGRGDNSHSPSMSTEADHGAQEYIEAPARTDILLAARPATAKLYEGEVPTLVAGDTHKQEIKEMGKSVFVNPGTAGAAFLRAFEKEPAARRTISVLYLHPDTKDPVAIVEYDLGEIGQLELSVNTCTVVDRDNNLKVVC